MQKFTLILRNDKAKSYTIISWLVIALNFMSFLYLAIGGSSRKTIFTFIAAALLLLIFMYPLVKKRLKDEDLLFRLSFSIIVVTWIVMEFYWAALINVFLFIFQDITRRQLPVLFFEDRIIYPSFPKRTIQWHELNNVIVKDGLLTIDLKTDKVFQNEIVSPVNEKELNQFFTVHLQPG